MSAVLFLGKANDCWNVDHMLETVHVLQLLSNCTSYPNKKIVGIDINFWLMEARLIPYTSTKTIPSIQIEVKKRNNGEVYHRKVSSNLNIFCTC